MKCGNISVVERAIAWLLQEEALTDEHAICEAAFAIVDYIADAPVAH